MYALGATLFEMLSGRPPFDGANPIEIIMAHATRPVPPVPDVPIAAERIVRRLMEKQPNARPPGYDELIEEIDRALAELRTGGGARAVLEAREPDEEEEQDTMLRSHVALARANVQMGRLDRAEKMYLKLLDQPGRLRLESALALGELYERQGDPTAAGAHWRIVVEESADPTEVTYARWKLGNQYEQQAAVAKEEAIRIYKEILEDESSPFPKILLEARIRWLEESIRAVRREIAASSVRLERKGRDER